MSSIKVDFPINEIEFIFETKSQGQIQLYLDNEKIDGYILPGQRLKKVNSFTIRFTKKDIGDTDSFAILKGVLINGYDFTERFKTIEYFIDKAHDSKDKSIANNLYFGFIGEMSFTIEQKNDELTKAAYTLAEKEFEYIKWPMVQGPHYREKTLENICRDTKYMFTGSLAPRSKEIVDVIDNFRIKDGKLPLEFDKVRSHIQDWINCSDRIKLENFSSMTHFNYANGVIPCLDSFAQRAERLYMPEKSYYFYKYYPRHRAKLKDLFNGEIKENSHVLIELPTLYYDNQSLLDKIKLAKHKNCRVALDLTWLPLSNSNLLIDLEFVDEIYFSMNKTWPVDDIRPAWRWSKDHIEDTCSFENEICIYPKMLTNLFLELTKKFPFDYVYNKYESTAKKIMQQFDLTSSPVLWFTKHASVTHSANPIFPGYYMDEFVCLRKLLEFEGKYFW